MDTTHLCPSCGKPLAPNAPKGLCPECLLKAGFPTGSQAEPANAAHPRPTSFTPPKPDELASHFPQLEIVELLGQGGMGAVYKAKQKGLDRLVALKVLPPEVAGSTAFAERFTREARAMARLSHPNIVAVYDFGQVGSNAPNAFGADVGHASRLSSSPSIGTVATTATGETPVPLYYFLMEFVDGVNLRQMLQAHRLSPREAMAIVPQICDALQYAHDKGIVHRDIKPENVLVDKQGRVKIADFGLAKLLGKDPQGERLTRSAELMGTPQYMAPEQLEKPLEVDHRADIYSLGVVFYEMLTGELPLGRFAAPSQKVQIDVRLDEVVLRALEKEPERRYQQASVLKTEVETIAATPSQTSTGASPVSSPSPQTGALRSPPNVVSPASVVDDEALAEARSRMKAPAIGLLVVGLLDVLLVLMFAMYGLSYAGRESATRFLVTWPMMVLIPVVALICFGANRMMRLRNYELAVTASILAMIVPPGLVVGLPFGIWALVVLSRREVRQAFNSIRHASPPSGVTESRVVGVVRWAARILGTLMFLLFAVFFVAEGTPPIPAQPAGVQIEFVGFFFMALGFLVGWKWEGWAALSILAGVTFFHLVEGKVLLPGALEAPAIVGVLYGLCWWMERRPPLRLPVTGTWAQVFRSTGVRLLILVVVHLTLFEVLNQASVHWKESTEELWLMVLAASSLAGLIWAFWPSYRLRGSILGVAAGTIAGALLVLALDNFYFWQVRPALGLHQEPDWVAQHPGFQRALRRRIGTFNPAKSNIEVTGAVTGATTGRPIAGTRPTAQRDAVHYQVGLTTRCAHEDSSDEHEKPEAPCCALLFPFSVYQQGPRTNHRRSFGCLFHSPAGIARNG